MQRLSDTTQPATSGRILLLGIFVLSGFAGLIYQSIWSHYLGIFLGHAAYAQALVLAIFMGGMPQARCGLPVLVSAGAILSAVMP